MDRIQTVNTTYKEILKEKGSSFIAYLFPAINFEEFKEVLNNLEKEYHDATHHCYAFKGIDDFKYSDDGEPNGTAGIRILNAIEHYNLINVGIVVIRYFGGIKLGVGPLGKAYYDASEQVIKSAKILEKFKYFVYQIIFNFDDSSKVYHSLNSYNTNIVDTNYDENNNITIEFEILSTDLESFLKSLNVISYRLKIKDLNKIFYK
ncbi:MAG TPA: YigZ family protein [Ignavibacteriales bacterium]|nr:YigZ family protein [Ignavibacteriales bacterium]HOL81135.1 YigZ family protein [Ignavibacteriales bacterium]HOM65238.1 YigZ family protein [Ignavibacteriales bacterium]HPD66530.1 YigZ family protein [Ignavibacteriales bacterium]HPP33509.1 YigZ family protein [Ignavibacteriales bacterium]